MLKYLKSYAEKSATRYTQLVPESLDTNDGLLKCIGAGFAIGAAGDQIAQRLELDDLEQAAHGATPTTPPTPPKLSTPPTTSVFLDWRRSIAWGVYLGGLNGVLIRSWYFHLEKRFGSAVVPKLIADQLIMAPVSTIMCLGFTGLLQVNALTSRPALSRPVPPRFVSSRRVSPHPVSSRPVPSRLVSSQN